MNDSNRRNLIFMFVLMGVVLVVGVVIVSFNIMNSNKENSDSNIDNDNATINVNPSPIDDTSNEALKREIIEKANMLEFYGTGKDISLYKSNIIMTNDIPDSKKLEIVLKGSDNSFENISIDTNNIDISDSTYKESLVSGSQISFSKVNESYRNLFGNTITDSSFVDVIDNCPKYFVDKTNKVYYKWINCGGTNDITNYKYDYGFEISNGEVHLYRAVGYSDSTNIYSDYDGNVYSTKSNNFSIDNSNYNGFSKFKFIFVENGNSYYFSKIERV